VEQRRKARRVRVAVARAPDVVGPGETPAHQSGVAAVEVVVLPTVLPQEAFVVAAEALEDRAADEELVHVHVDDLAAHAVFDEYAALGDDAALRIEDARAAAPV